MLSRISRTVTKPAFRQSLTRQILPAFTPLATSRFTVRFFATREKPKVFGFSGKTATQLFDKAKEESVSVSDFRDDLSRFSQAYKQDTDLHYALDPGLEENFDKTLTALCEALKIPEGSMSQKVLSELAYSGKLDKLPAILEDFNELLRYENNEVQASVVSAIPLSSKQTSALKDALQTQLEEGQKLILDQSVDPSILGGIKVSVGDKSIDLDVASRINEIDRSLRERA